MPQINFYCNAKLDDWLKSETPKNSTKPKTVSKILSQVMNGEYVKAGEKKDVKK